MNYQLLPPKNHRRNIAKKSIQTWKDHFVAVLSGTADNFPLHLWCQIIPHMEHQLNLITQSHALPHTSTYALLYGHLDYNAMTFSPLGIESLTHDKPNQRKTFAQHCRKGWVINPSPEHYICCTVWAKDTRGTRISKNVFFKHKYLSNPTVTPEGAIIAAALNQASVLKNNPQEQHLTQIKLHDLTRLK